MRYEQKSAGRVNVIYDGHVYQLGPVTYKKIVTRIAEGQPVASVMAELVGGRRLDVDLTGCTQYEARNHLARFEAGDLDD
jgi:hypothetical protein